MHIKQKKNMNFFWFRLLYLNSSERESNREKIKNTFKNGVFLHTKQVLETASLTLETARTKHNEISCEKEVLWYSQLASGKAKIHYISVGCIWIRIFSCCYFLFLHAWLFLRYSCIKCFVLIFFAGFSLFQPVANRPSQPSVNCFIVVFPML